MDDGAIHIRYRPMDLSSLLPSKENRMRSQSNTPHSKSKGLIHFFLEIIEKISIDYFQLLSDEIILSILKYLPRSSLAAMGQVCRRLRSLT